MMSIIGWIFVFLIVFVLGCMRGQAMEKERAEKLKDTDIPFYLFSNGEKVFLITKK